MSHKDVYAAIHPILPAVRGYWPDNSAPNLPWAAFYEEGTDNLFADGRVYSVIHSWAVEVHMLKADENILSKVEAAISDKFGPWQRNEYYEKSEHVLIVTYYFTEIEKKN